MHRDDADVVILSLGIDRDVEHEDKDRHNTTLSDPQEQLALAVLAKQKPTVLVIVGDDIDGIDNLIEGSAAIVKAFYPGVQGAKALAAQLFGTENRWYIICMHYLHALSACPIIAAALFDSSL